MGIYGLYSLLIILTPSCANWSYPTPVFQIPLFARGTGMGTIFVHFHLYKTLPFLVLLQHNWGGCLNLGLLGCKHFCSNKYFLFFIAAWTFSLVNTIQGRKQNINLRLKWRDQKHLKFWFKHLLKPSSAMDCFQCCSQCYFSLHTHTAGMQAVMNDQLSQHFLKIWAHSQALVS